MANHSKRTQHNDSMRTRSKTVLLNELPDIEFSQRWSKALGQTFQSEFRGAVDFTERVTIHSDDTAHVDNVALLPRFHARENSLEHAHSTEKVGVKQVLGCLDRNAFKHTH